MKNVYQLKCLDCANCASKIETKISELKSVESVTVDFIQKKLILELKAQNDEKTISQIKQLIKKLEPKVELIEISNQDYSTKEKEELKKQIIKFLIGLILFIITIILHHTIIKDKQYLILFFYIICYLITGIKVLIKATKNIINKELFDENFLMSLATIGAFFIGEYTEAVAVMLFYQLGEIFQDYSVNNTRKQIATLMDIRPNYANVETNGKIKKMKPEYVKINEIILVKPGEKVPLDGIVIEGVSFIDTRALTGESVPRKINIGDVIYSGCLNQEGVLKIRVTSEYNNSTVSKILDLVENASNRKSQTENFITKFARYYTPIVVGLAFLLAIIPPLITETSFSSWFYRSLSFLVVSCPCALIISIPLSFFTGVGLAAKQGILIKGSNYLENLTKIKQIVFDKTGTLTKGIFEVQEIYSPHIPKEKLLEMVAHTEFYSNHPIAISVKKAYSKELLEQRVKNVKEISGLGIEAIFDEKNILVGNEKLMIKNNINIELCPKIGTIIYIAIDSKYAGYILISDSIKETSTVLIDELKKLNIRDFIMLTGDNQEIGEYIAKEIGITEVYSELFSDEKVKQMEQILKNKHPESKVAFVGDGINDAPVLALSDIGIAMGAIGSDAAIEAADVVIMNDDLTKILSAIKLSKRTLTIVKQNICLAITLKILILILSALGITTMWSAVFADVGVTIISILNSLRLLKKY